MNDITRALACALEYRERGLSPLPSRAKEKAPALPGSARYFDGEPVPDWAFERWDSPNIQVITGNDHAGPLKIAVVDLDGDEAAEVWGRMCAAHGYRTRTPWVARTGSGGTHLYFALPASASKVPSGLIWGLWDSYGKDGKGAWAKHKEIRILGDRALVVAPPSRHVETGIRYAFLPGLGPNEVPIPEEIPAWVLAMPRLVSPRLVKPPERPRVEPSRGPVAGRYDRDRVLAAIPNKIELAASWGLHVESNHPNASGWVSCYVPGRESREQGSKPSGSMHAEDGTFQDRRDDSSMSLFDLGSILQPGLFPRWHDCLRWCGARYG